MLSIGREVSNLCLCLSSMVLVELYLGLNSLPLPNSDLLKYKTKEEGT